MSARDDVLFEIETPLGFRVCVTRARWALISNVKHPAMAGKEFAVKAVLDKPDQIRQSRSDSQVYLFYKAEEPKRWVCAVVREGADDGFLITAYPTDAIKEGTKVWPK